VRLGGVPLPEIDPGRLRTMMALIPQEAYVFTGSLRENLCYLRPDASDLELNETCQTVPLGPLVERVGGFDGPVSAGSLSAGERQLIALGRVHLSRASVVILDEATCYLDPVAEATVEEAFAARPGSLVVIAHRISSALRADRVLLLDGSAALVGSHAELLAASPFYADLVGHWGGEPSRGEPVRPGAIPVLTQS
jgi:ATP-binding cassette subfamily C protein